jgi:hypothetical protein
MGIINCKECGMVCLESVNQLCTDCQQEFQRSEQRVIEYLEDNPKSSLDEVHKATRVSRHVIMQMIRNNRILTGMVSYPCESCSEPIIQGRICTKCADEVIKYLGPREKITDDPGHRAGAMYIKHSNDRRR